MLYNIVYNSVTYQCYVTWYIIVYLTYYAGRSAPSDGHGCSKFIHCQRTPDKEHVKKYKNGSAELKDLIQHVLHNPDFYPAEVDHDMHERLITDHEAGDIEVIDLWEEGDGNQDVDCTRDQP